MKNRAIEWLKTEYDENRITELVDDQICSGDWLDPDWQDEFEDEFEAYNEQGRGGAEDSVRDDIQTELLNYLQTDIEQYQKEAGENIWETIQEIYPKLDT